MVVLGVGGGSDQRRRRAWEVQALAMACQRELGPEQRRHREEDGARIMQSKEISVRVDLGRGTASANVYTCDFSYDYVKINADYRS